MVFDEVRNNAYTEALKNLITPKSVVLDLGAGLGVHGLVAAKLGAKRVYMVDPSPVLHVAEKIASANGFGEQIHFIQKPIEQVDLPEKVDIILSVFTGNFLLTEDLLPLLFQTRDRFLKPGGILVPDCARMEVAAVSVPSYYEKHIDCWKTRSQGLNFDLVREYAVNTLYYDSAESFSAKILSKSAKLLELDFISEIDASCRSTVQIECDFEGICHGFLGWFQTRLGGEWLSTSPTAEKTHWSQVLLPLSTPVEVCEGDIFEFELHRPESGEWTWTSKAGDQHQRHSTFLSTPLLPAELLKQTKNYRAKLSRQGETVREILCSLDGSHTNESVIDKVLEMSPDMFQTPQQVETLIKKLINRYAE